MGQTSAAKKKAPPRDAAGKVAQQVSVWLSWSESLATSPRPAGSGAWTGPVSRSGSAGSRPRGSTG
jgi:hypothetical protein